jgi:hypothetical protein
MNAGASGESAIAYVGASHAAVRIAGDRGGQIGEYVSKFQRLHFSGQSVVIDGLCASACTLVLAAVPHGKICVTPRATLGFHAAYDFGVNGRTVTNPEATGVVFELPDARAAVDRHSRWTDASDNLPAREAATSDVPTVSFDASRVRRRVDRSIGSPRPLAWAALILWRRTVQPRGSDSKASSTYPAERALGCPSNRRAWYLEVNLPLSRSPWANRLSIEFSATPVGPN